jgi:hypothetical protein
MKMTSLFLAAALALVSGASASAAEQRGVIQVTLTVVPMCQVQSSGEIKAACTAGGAFKVSHSRTSSATASSARTDGKLVTVTF